MENAETEFSLKEWDVRARIVSRQNTGSRRFSASHVRTLREEARSFRSNFTVSSTASSPGYLLRDEIDPTTYSFTNAVKALQAKQRYVNVWDSMSPEGFVLNSKWSDAERYICNPLSGEVPLECLSAKTLSQRSFQSITGRITMSAPLVYPSHYPRNIQPRQPPPASTTTATSHNSAFLPIQEKKAGLGRTRDVGIQSTAPDSIRSSSPSHASTPSISERKVKWCASEAEDSLNSESKVISEEEGEEKEEGGKGDERTVIIIQGIDSEIEDENEEEESVEGGGGESGSNGQVRMKCRQGGCLSWGMVMRKKKKNKKKKKNHKPNRMHRLLFLPRIKGC
ncbi:hypothetical protein MLD38_001544 [Melastoma candidum]|uniref:Uncharacterized protein n=1 Tax=Melastoma candidum TaxID=119954 RepID=A0ACB9SDI2_9MYRT|nr:hypothetical protein MLD38_001544 [Melastoma candidum]